MRAYGTWYVGDICSGPDMGYICWPLEEAAMGYVIWPLKCAFIPDVGICIGPLGTNCGDDIACCCASCIEPSEFGLLLPIMFMLLLFICTCMKSRVNGL